MNSPKVKFFDGKRELRHGRKNHKMFKVCKKWKKLKNFSLLLRSLKPYDEKSSFPIEDQLAWFLFFNFVANRYLMKVKNDFALVK